MNTGSAQGFPWSPSHRVRTLHLGFLSHALNSCLDAGPNRFMARSCRHGHNLKLASQRGSAAVRLWALGSVAAPAPCPLVTCRVWVPQLPCWHRSLGITTAPPRLHVRSRAHPCFPTGITVSHCGSLDTSLGTEGCKSRTMGAEGGLGSSPLQLRMLWHRGKSGVMS